MLTDQLRVPLHANHLGKCKGKKLGPDLDMLEGGELLPKRINKHVVWRLILQEYNLIGLLGPILLKSKLLFRELCIFGLSWNDVIPDKLRQDRVAITIERKELNKIRFARSLVPECPTGYPLLVTFSDGSKVAYACISYLCWPTKNGVL
ncbi:MAG: hypothetical protein GY696_13730 [Gammaproteobacteria bacterium]|nr:hypothetical protein [Gammaproteobacteria bacterium]